MLPYSVGRPFLLSPSGCMIICSCNVLSDHEVRAALAGAASPRTPGQVYGCLGCSAQCGRCARTIKRIMDEALNSCASACAHCDHAPRATSSNAGPSAESDMDHE
jgi:bacterioferritin-associated ferredoxin